jgi:predicted CoA-binding protein
MKTKNTVLLGASENPERYSYLATQKLVAHQHPITAIGVKQGHIGTTPIITDHPAIADVDTVTLYLSPANQKSYYDYILSLKPKRLIFNPGTENDELSSLAKSNGIQPIEACTLVMLSTGQY